MIESIDSKYIHMNLIIETSQNTLPHSLPISHGF